MLPEDRFRAGHRAKHITGRLSTRLILKTSLRGRCYPHLHFTKRETEVQKPTESLWNLHEVIRLESGKVRIDPKP